MVQLFFGVGKCYFRCLMKIFHLFETSVLIILLLTNIYDQISISICVMYMFSQVTVSHSA